MNKNKRRDFLKNSALIATGLSLAASAGFASSSGIKKGKVKKNETLYKRTPTWSLYYERSK